MAFTVKATVAGIQFSLALRVAVLTGVTEAGGRSGGSLVSPPNISLSPLGSGSYIIECLYNESNSTAFTAAASNTLTNATAAGSTEVAYGTYTGAVTLGTPVTVGATAPTGQATAIASYEFLAAGSPAQDASTPALVNGSTSPATTASFTPPGSCVLAAMVMFAQSSASAPVMSDTSGFGLVWTSRASFLAGASGQSAVIFTTTIGGAAASILPQQAKKRMPAYFTRIVSSRQGGVYSR